VKFSRCFPTVLPHTSEPPRIPHSLHSQKLHFSTKFSIASPFARSSSGIQRRNPFSMYSTVQGKNSLLTTDPTKPSCYLTPLLPSHTLQQNSRTKSQTQCPSSLPRSSFHHITAYSSPEEPHSHTPTSHHHPCTHVQPQTLKPRVLRTQSSLT